MKPRDQRRIAALLEQRARSAESTRLRLHQALDRFEHDQLVNLPRGMKLTVRNLAAEAEVSKDTPLSRYRGGRRGRGEYRFPDVAARFISLKEKLARRPAAGHSKDVKIQELREVIKVLREQLLLAHRVNNRLDAEVYEKTRRVRELEEHIAKVRRDNLKVIKFDKNKGGRGK